MPNDATAELLDLSLKLLQSIAESDWATYADLCDPSLTAFEPEALGHLIHGLEFHEFYFKLSTGPLKPQNSIVDPHLRIMGDVAVVSYYRLTQVADEQGGVFSKGTEETRVWQKKNGQWKHVHFHRSPSQRS